MGLWREALLAQKILKGATRGYRNHPQLERFRQHPAPEQAIASYLISVWEEAKVRGYRFDKKKIGKRKAPRKIPVTKGQLRYEFEWLYQKLKSRSPKQYKLIALEKKICPRPFFRPVEGLAEPWERIKL